MWYISWCMAPKYYKGRPWIRQRGRNLGGWASCQQGKPEDLRSISLHLTFHPVLWYLVSQSPLSIREKYYRHFSSPACSAPLAIVCLLPLPWNPQIATTTTIPTLKNRLMPLLATKFLLPLNLLPPSSLLSVVLTLLYMLLFCSASSALHLNYLHQSSNFCHPYPPIPVSATQIDPLGPS